MPLHGHATLELTDVRTGRRQVVEQDNLVTNAVAELFTPVGMANDLYTLLHDTTAMADFITRLYGGLILYDTALDADPACLFAPAAAGVTGCGVYNKTNTGENPIRGSCNTAETVVDLEGGSVKFVYDFATNQANGSIAALCLTSARGGLLAAESPVECAADAASASPLLDLLAGNSHRYSGQWLCYLTARASWLAAPGRLLEIDPETDTCLTAQLVLAGGGASVILRRYPAMLRSVSLFWARGTTLPAPLDETELTVEAPLQSDSNTATLCNLCYDGERRKLYLSSAPARYVEPNQALTVVEIDPLTNGQESYVVTNQTGVRLNHEIQAAEGSRLTGYVYDGYLYACAYTAVDGVYPIYKIRLDNPADVVQVEQNGFEMRYVVDAHDGRLYGGYGSKGVTVLNTHTNRLLRTELYTAASGLQYLYNPHLAGRQVVQPTNNSYSSTAVKGLYLGMRPNYLGTINNLAEPVEKTAEKTMKVTYVLTQSG